MKNRISLDFDLKKDTYFKHISPTGLIEVSWVKVSPRCFIPLITFGHVPKDRYFTVTRLGKGDFALSRLQAVTKGDTVQTFSKKEAKRFSNVLMQVVEENPEMVASLRAPTIH